MIEGFLNKDLNNSIHKTTPLNYRTNNKNRNIDQKLDFFNLIDCFLNKHLNKILKNCVFIIRTLWAGCIYIYIYGHVQKPIRPNTVMTWVPVFYLCLTCVLPVSWSAIPKIKNPQQTNDFQDSPPVIYTSGVLLF